MIYFRETFNHLDLVALGRFIGTLFFYSFVMFSHATYSPKSIGINLIIKSFLFSAAGCLVGSFLGLKLYLLYVYGLFGLRLPRNQRAKASILVSCLVLTTSYLLIVTWGYVPANGLFFLSFSPGVIESSLSILLFYIVLSVCCFLFPRSCFFICSCWHRYMYLMVGFGIYSLAQEVFVAMLGSLIMRLNYLLI